jgi:uncharacterized protein with PIN domain
MNTGKCPKCDRLLTNVLVEEIKVNVGFSPTWRGASFVCPYCHAILSVGIDPIALQEDIVKEVLQGLGKG